MYSILAFLLPIATIILVTLIILFFIADKYWSSIALHFRHSKTFYGESFDKIKMKVNGMNFYSLIKLKYNDEGIYLGPRFPLSIFQKPIFCSWNEITEINREKPNGEVEIKVGASKSDTVTFSKETYSKLESAFIKYKEYVQADE